MSERKAEIQAGIAFLLSVIVLIAGVLWFKNFRIASKNVKIQVEFPNTSGLVKGDPVEVRGVPSGQVDEIRYKDGGAVVLVRLDRGVELRRDARFMIKNVGIMGQKMVAVDPGSERAIVAPAGTKFEGGYEPGIPEFISNMGQTVETFGRLGERLDSVLASLQQNDKGNLAQTLANLEAITTDLRTFLEATRGDLASSVHNLNSAMTELNRTLDGREEVVGKLLDNTARASVHFDSTLVILDRTAATADSLLGSIHAGKGSMGMLVRDETLYRELLDTVRETRALVTDMKAHPHKYVKLSLF